MIQMMEHICPAWEMKAWTTGTRKKWLRWSSRALSEMGEGQSEADHWPKDPGSPLPWTPQKRGVSSRITDPSQSEQSAMGND